ncbi:c-type cytochrome [Pontibacter qinzhouensis]|uniref:C-type cytochrome n=1 Tax=Pontibacter qinzhouensis TaxID=2603253 RepID=A0A5C8KBG3_9BACT|nr:c-type cytochrome [Pontibacter qinzhouensis]TXK50532.1 c-type cytochrome [Pontibacter qinzhouensis]
MTRSIQAVLFSVGLLLFFVRCQQDTSPAEAEAAVATTAPDSLAIREMYAASPILSPEASMKKMQLEEGFRVDLVAAEPLVIAPVAMTFDEQGRLWVAEMMNYMPDTAGTGEELPTGKIIILEDQNRDGHYDKRTIFLDSLVLPRALCLIENGLLVAEPPYLWFYEINGNRPGKKTLVDDKYTSGANVEHEPNGLLRALDNWIYNAKSSTRYRKKGNKWLKEETHFRGQWGITQDDYGRLYYNNNSQNLLGDFLSPGFRPTNSNQRSLAGFNENIVPDNRVYPARATTGVNRGYMEGTLDENLRLINFTAACGPALNRGTLFGDGYYLDAFVAEPAGNLIKRNRLQQQGYQVHGEQAYTGKEFLASEDERFRPANLYSGPDGALYVLDMYRGIIQHKHFLTDYLAQEIMQRSLNQPLSCGRIYRIVPKGKKVKPVLLPQDPEKLVRLLQHSNGWVRDRSQQLLIDKKQVQAIPALRQLLHQAQQPLPRLHALWTLEGLDALQETDVLPLLQHPDWPVRMQALSTLPSVLTRKNYRKYVPALQQLLQQNDTLAAPVIAYLANTIQPFSKASSDGLLQTLLKQYPNNNFVADALISNLQGREEAFYQKALAIHNDSCLALCLKLEQVIAAKAEAKTRQNQELVDRQFPRGAALYVSHCQSCHGADGGGMKALAPPLNKSEWVTGSENRLIPILLHGLTGPILVNGKLYQAPEINGDMPAFGNNSELSDKDLAELASYIRRSWNNKATHISEQKVTSIRQKYTGRQNAFTMDELLKLPD